MQWFTGSTLGQTVIVTGALLVTAVPLFALGCTLHGIPGCLTVAAAFATCLIGAFVSLSLARLFVAPTQVMHQVLFGMVPRMGLPLVACMLVYLHGGMLVEAGFVYYIMAFYFVTLLVETVLLAGSTPSKPRIESRTR